MAFPAEYWEIWTTNVPEEGPSWMSLAMTLGSEANAIRLCTAVECPYPSGEIWHITYTEFTVLGIGLLSRRTATQVTY